MLSTDPSGAASWIPRRRLLAFLAAFLLITVGGCGGVGSDPDDGTTFDTEVEAQTLANGAVNTEEIDRGQYGDIVEGTRTVARDQATYEELWSQLHADESAAEGEGSNPPELSFDSHVVVAVVLGERPTGGYAVDVDAVQASEDGGEMRVEFTETVPGAGCAVTQALTSPYVLVAVDVQDESIDANAEVTFNGSEETRSC